MESIIGSTKVATEKFFNLVAFASHKVAMLVDDSNFLAWKQHVLLVFKTHWLLLFIEGTIVVPSQLTVSEDGVSVKNLTYVQYE
ncbi:hypothetical protein GOBAR_AA09678 [Gossypium barbadense]|uniref:Retrotransposon Copia-like N-terminal domain-containing protein n=1 Tax=Gossypium barbadense TaxID=3634 RepID=A0A2P5Y5V5_GOSBA|nr:hypothetical protein GOBAR_AA09678 [Gossypium barbadense]